MPKLTMFLALLLATAFVSALTEEPPAERWFFDLRTLGGPLPIEIHGPIKPSPWGAYGDTGSRTEIVNGDERIRADRAVIDTDGASFGIGAHLHGFASQLEWFGTDTTGPTRWSGRWTIDRRSGETTIPFTISSRDKRFPLPDTPPTIDSGRYRVTFASSPDDPAVGLFTINGDGTATGTFLTTTGDYRYLAGNAAGGTLRLSTFDGAHAFLFHAEKQPDGSLKGDFWSGTWWHETWTAVPDPDFRLPDPFAITKYRGDAASLERMAFSSLEGVPTPVGALAPHGSPRVVVVFGSWCPNCHDATRLLGEFHEAYRERGLKVLGLAFEHSADEAEAIAAVEAYRRDLGVGYPLLVAGLSDKKKASEALPVLDRVRSYPTTLFIDADGDIRAVHTGFSGPATGAAHTELRERWAGLIEAMLAEHEAGGLMPGG
jgi:thiol-disulfide isomerase/thioredoxin